MSTFMPFAAAVTGAKPRVAVVLGSGLGAVTTHFAERHSIPFGDIPGLVPSKVPGHRGRLALGEWSGVPALVFLGRLHLYEGHPWEVVTGTVRVAAELGVERLLLTNAAGGIHPSLGPGSLMALRGHIKLLGANGWRDLALERGRDGRRSRPEARAPECPYSPRLLEVMQRHEAAAGREMLAGVYAALTGPNYETPAEIRALAACGADAVGMSTAVEAEAAAALGLEVAAASCVTNRAAGLTAAPLDHAEVLANAKLTAARLADVITAAVRA
jgi:purine-nucleoside phosphorylase